MNRALDKWNEMRFSKDDRVKKFRDSCLEKAKNIRLKEQMHYRNLALASDDRINLKEMLKKDFEDFKKHDMFLDLTVEQEDELLKSLEQSLEFELDRERMYIENILSVHPNFNFRYGWKFDRFLRI